MNFIKALQKTPFWILSLSGFVIFVLFNLFMDVPERISRGEKGQLAIQLLDEMRRPILAIKNTSHLNTTHKEKYESFKKSEQLAHKLIIEYLSAASYNKELLDKVKQLSIILQQWLLLENQFWTMHISLHKNTNSKNRTAINQDIDNNTYIIFFQVLDVLALGEKPVHHDIDDGREASSVFKLSASVLALYMFLIILLFQRVRHNELVESNKKMYEELSKSFNALEKRSIELQRATNIAETANKTKSEFLSNMSHELRTPMHSILAFAELGQSDVKNTTTEKLEKYFSRILEGGTRLMTLLDSLLELSKFESGKMEMKFSESDLRDIVATSINEVEAYLKQLGLTVTVDDNDCNSLVILDTQQISQVIHNLLSNAIKFSPQHSKIKIKIENDSIVKNNDGEADTSIAAIRFSIFDQGVGIPEDELEVIFDKFSQSSSTKTGAGGTGLGLSISKDIIEAHSGKIWAENNQSESGSVLSFVIPQKQ